MNATTKVVKAKQTAKPKDVKVDDGLPRDGRGFGGLFVVDELTRPNMLDFRRCKDLSLKTLLRGAVSDAKGHYEMQSMNDVYSVGLLAEVWDGFTGKCEEHNFKIEEWPDLVEKISGAREGMRKALADKVAKGVLEYGDLPVYFGKGAEVAFELDGEPAGGKIVSVALKSSWMGPRAVFMVSMIHNIGGNVKEDSIEVSMPGWYGLMEITKLPIHPITDAEKAHLDVRGAKFVKFGEGSSYLQYAGQMARSSWMGTRLYRADGRVMVDAMTFAQVDGNQHRYECNALDADIDRDSGKKVDYVIDDGDRWRTVPFMYGFSFAAKTWGRLRVEGLSEIVWREDAFEKLVLPEKQKGLVKALVEHSVGSFTDIIDGKGGGCIFLLHGPPGQGKTLTAETVSEALKRPLYSVSVGELGTNPDVLEQRLRQILDVATTWNGVLLLDEADIFLEARDEKDIVRNAMVGVFLRLLEYHQGVLFLTTNRVKNIDEAFYSRVSVAIEYPEGTSDKRRLIWKGLLDSAGVKGLDVEALSAHELNGRQIKNVIRLSQTLARSEGREVDEATIREVVDLTTAFNRSHVK